MSQFSISGGSGPPPPGTVTQLDGNSGTATPSSGVINVIGQGSLVDGFSTNGNILTSGSGNTLTVYETQAQYVTNYTATSTTPYSALPNDYYISVDCSGGAFTVLIPDSPTAFRMFLIKDRLGDAGTNPITITTPGATTLIDGDTTYILDTEFEAVLLTFNGTEYEAF